MSFQGNCLGFALGGSTLSTLAAFMLLIRLVGCDDDNANAHKFDMSSLNETYTTEIYDGTLTISETMKNAKLSTLTADFSKTPAQAEIYVRRPSDDYDPARNELIIVERSHNDNETIFDVFARMNQSPYNEDCHFELTLTKDGKTHWEESPCNAREISY